MLPAGELDGGRIALGLWGRHVARALSVFSLLLLGLAGFRSSLALFWLLAVVTLQRGPIVPCDNEVSRPNGPAATVVALALFALTLLVLLPYPFASTDVGPGLPLGGDLPQINL